jgi:hypothetical protein
MNKLIGILLLLCAASGMVLAAGGIDDSFKLGLKAFAGKT